MNLETSKCPDSSEDIAVSADPKTVSPGENNGVTEEHSDLIIIKEEPVENIEFSDIDTEGIGNIIGNI